MGCLRRSLNYMRLTYGIKIHFHNVAPNAKTMLELPNFHFRNQRIVFLQLLIVVLKYFRKLEKFQWSQRDMESQMLKPVLFDSLL